MDKKFCTPTAEIPFLPRGIFCFSLRSQEEHCHSAQAQTNSPEMRGFGLVCLILNDFTVRRKKNVALNFGRFWMNK